ncbi:MAG: hypothetical protein SGI77_23640 [Pirellulaceae bacterium]|nr:hypothetical protein [Pirellulaceae bacterium]
MFILADDLGIGNVCNDLIDSTHLLPTFAQLAGARLAEGDLLDGHSFSPQLLGQLGAVDPDVRRPLYVGFAKTRTD